jgi:hypothetical protein
MSRTKKVKALYSLIGLANKAKDLREYRLANLTFGLAISLLENDEFELVYEDAGSPLSAYYDVVTIYLHGRGLSIPAPLLNKDTLAECLKKGKIVDLLEHNRQFKDIDSVEVEKSFSRIVSRYLRILRYLADELLVINDIETIIETAKWALDLPIGQREAFERWCNSLCQSVAELNLV